MQTEAQKPQNQKHHTNSPKHSHVLCSSSSTTRKVGSVRNQLTVFGTPHRFTDQDCSHGVCFPSGRGSPCDVFLEGGRRTDGRIVHATDLSKAIGREIHAGSSIYSCLCS